MYLQNEVMKREELLESGGCGDDDDDQYNDQALINDLNTKLKSALEDKITLERQVFLLEDQQEDYIESLRDVDQRLCRLLITLGLKSPEVLTIDEHREVVTMLMKRISQA